MRWVAFATIFAGLCGYAVFLLASSTLGAGPDFVTFNVFWGLTFAVAGVLAGIMHETARAIRAATGRDEAGDDPTVDVLLTERVGPEELAPTPTLGARPLPVALAIGLVVGGLVAATGPLWAIALLGSVAQLGVLLAAVASALAAVQFAVFGMIGGRGRHGRLASLMTLEATARVAVALAIAIAADSPVAGFLYATVAGCIALPVSLLLPGTRRTLAQRADVLRPEFIRRTLGAMLASGASAALVLGFPVLFTAARPGTDAVVLSNLLLAVTLTRAPVFMTVASFQNAIVVYFVERLRLGRRAVIAPAITVLGMALLGAALAWLLGEPVIMMLGPGFNVGGQVLGALVVAAGCTGVLSVTGCAVLARERHAAYIAGWLSASVIAVVLLLVVPGALVATVLALTVGPIVGVAVHVLIGLRPGVGAGRRGDDRAAAEAVASAR